MINVSPKVRFTENIKMQSEPRFRWYSMNTLNTGRLKSRERTSRDLTTRHQIKQRCRPTIFMLHGISGLNFIYQFVLVFFVICVLLYTVRLTVVFYDVFCQSKITNAWNIIGFGYLLFQSNFVGSLDNCLRIVEPTSGYASVGYRHVEIPPLTPPQSPPSHRPTLVRIVPPAAVLSGTLLLGTPSVQPCSNSLSTPHQATKVAENSNKL